MITDMTSSLTAGVTGGGADVDNDWEQYKLEARKILAELLII
jgi:hypothetical protein